MGKLIVFNYIDGISNIALIDGVIRMDLLTLSRGTQEKPQAVTSGQLCMSTRAFLRAYQQMTDVLADLEKQGLIKKKEINQSPDLPTAQKSDGKAKTASKK